MKKIGGIVILACIAAVIIYGTILNAVNMNSVDISYANATETEKLAGYNLWDRDDYTTTVYWNGIDAIKIRECDANGMCNDYSVSLTAPKSVETDRATYTVEEHKDFYRIKIRNKGLKPGN